MELQGTVRSLRRTDSCGAKGSNNYTSIVPKTLSLPIKNLNNWNFKTTQTYIIIVDLESIT